VRDVSRICSLYKGNPYTLLARIGNIDMPQEAFYDVLSSKSHK
jgi:hypothetical protein